MPGDWHGEPENRVALRWTTGLKPAGPPAGSARRLPIRRAEGCGRRAKEGRERLAPDRIRGDRALAASLRDPRSGAQPLRAAARVVRSIRSAPPPGFPASVPVLRP